MAPLPDGEFAGDEFRFEPAGGRAEDVDFEGRADAVTANVFAEKEVAS